MQIHIIPNSHLDPVWLWDWREGLNEGIITCRAILKLMEEFPELTYIRGESAIYAHIQKHAPEMFAQIQQRIAEGRWEVVGGTHIQPDTNLPATESLVRQFTSGLNYFRRELGVRPTVAWAADSFGHSAGLPEVLAAAGMTSFACSRPMEQDYHLDKPAFWWESASGKRILSWRIPVGWYGTNRDEVTQRLDQTLIEAKEWGLDNVAVFVGLGNHGGGPSRRQILDILDWREKHKEVEVRFSGLHRFFEALRKENATLPVVRGELNYTLRGCYSSAARFKSLYRKTENLLCSAEQTATIIAATADRKPADFKKAWESVLFNGFHDILPGTSIERAFDDQFAWVGQAWHEAQELELGALNALSAMIDTTVAAPTEDMPCGVPMVVWNPHPVAFQGPVELEAALDYRPISLYDKCSANLPVEVLDGNGSPLAFQRIEQENNFTPSMPWRVRIATNLSIPAFGWHVVTMAWKDNPRLAAPALSRTSGVAVPGQIENDYFTISATPHEIRLQIVRKDGTPFLEEGGLRVASYEDIYGAWGGHDGEREADSINEIKEYWQIEQAHTLEHGPERAALWVRFTNKKSHLDVTCLLSRESDRIDFSARLFINEPGHRVKLLFPAGEKAVFEVPGGSASRGVEGEVPGGRWVQTERFLFASDALYNFSIFEGDLGATVARLARYSCSVPTDPNTMPWKAYMDSGEHRFNFALAPVDRSTPYRFADSVERPPIAIAASAHPGSLPKIGSLGTLTPSSLRLLAFKAAEEGDAWVIRIHETTGEPQEAVLQLGAATIALGPVKPFEIASWKLVRGEQQAWRVLRIDASEMPLFPLAGEPSIIP